ncbi:phosphate ABC transporter substrate-binding protein PstS [Actinoplanes sp. TRM 88003]|uniref:Phosphate-binding protein n=1 Tax=Paractinoplanes aksuensis TaxID=2939490 RepID=A0ABT1DKT2_9ACTN|nr:phosphate ABC transporter substrate-binding protein PstS [Actinoplanes aksuensis]MCO8271452.1 phosphate ABC transporter substrate-binding protein PstS [Actinoplanes aksuensis]
MRKRIIAAALLLLGVAACESPSTPPRAAIDCTGGSITAQGSSAQANAVSAWIKDYQVSCAEATIEYASTGSGAGRRSFYAGTGDFAGSDSPIAAAEQARATARCRGPVLHLPMVVGPIALAFTVTGVDDLRLSPATIARIFTGRITRWNDPKIKADNPGVALPSTPVRPVYRSDSSGTTDNFTKFLTATAATDFRRALWPPATGVGADGSNRVVSAIERTDGAIGYVESSYARFSNLPTTRVGNAAGEFVALNDAAAARTVAGAEVTGAQGDLRLELDYRTGDALAYPLVLVTYEIACRQGSSELTKSFLAYAASRAGQDTAAASGYAPLPDELRTRVEQSIASL